MFFRLRIDFMVSRVCVCGSNGSYKWHHVVLFYERNGHFNVAGLHTCHLLMQTMANTYRNHNITYKSFATDSAISNHTESLRREVGVDASSKYKQIHVHFIPYAATIYRVGTGCGLTSPHRSYLLLITRCLFFLSISLRTTTHLTLYTHFISNSCSAIRLFVLSWRRYTK